MTETQRYNQLANQRKTALDKSDKTYQDLLNRNTEYSNSVNDYLDKYQNTQNEVYDKQLAYQVDLQNQNKEKAEKDYLKEAQASKNAYYDFINPYGVQAEIQAQNGLNRSGYSETTKSQAWTTQQNRTAQARAVMSEAKLQFDNAIKEAQLNNDTLKAQLALQMLQQKQEEALRSFNYVSDTKKDQLNNYQTLDSEYNNRYNILYSQIQAEKERAEAIRQWNAEMKFKQQQAKIAQQQWEKEYALSKANTYSSIASRGSRSSGSGGTISLSDGGSSNKKYAVNTAYYQGNLNSDANKYGTFSNGYQPKGISGHGELSKSGDTVTFNTRTLSGQGQTVTQNVWKAKDGTRWYWDGRYNKYIQMK